MPPKNVDTDKPINPQKLIELMETVHEKLNKGNHPLKRKDPALKDDSLLLLTATAGADNDIDPREVQFLKYIASSLGISKIDFYFTLCAKLTASRLETAIRSVKKDSAGAHLLLDALILASSDGPISEKESQFIGLLADCIEISYPDVAELIKLASAIISKSPPKLNDYLKGSQPIKVLSIQSLYLKQITGIDKLSGEDSSVPILKTKIKKSDR